MIICSDSSFYNLLRMLPRWIMDVFYFPKRCTRIGSRKDSLSILRGEPLSLRTKSTWRVFPILFLLLCGWEKAEGQVFGGLPPSIKWKQINTDTARIIFPDYLENQAQRVANAVHYLSANEVDEIGDKAFKIDIVLNNQSTISHGSVSIAPWKSHFITSPLQDNFGLTSLPWLDLLAIHEYRHVIQLSTARRGLVNWLYHIFGQESWAGAANLSIPNWFTEGDAVWAETDLTAQGRGRISRFLQGYKALDNADVKYSYNKVRNGSLKDYVPDHYRLGYLMVKHAQEKHGYHVWKDIMRDAASYKGIFYPFAHAMEKKLSYRPKEMYEEMLLDRHKKWEDFTEITSARTLLPTVSPETFTDYHYPYHISDSSLTYYKRSYHEIGKFYHYNRNTKLENVLTTKGLAIDTYYGYGGGILSWTEITPHPRWIERDYTDLITYDLRSGERRRITRRKKYFSPQPNNNGTQIACVRLDESAMSSLVVIDISSSKVVNQYDHPGWIYTYPRWDQNDDKIVTAVRDEQGLMGLIEVDLDSGKETEILPFKNRIIGAPWVEDEKIYFSSTTELTEQIFAFDRSTGIRTQITHERNGAFQPSIWKDSLYYVTFTHLGRVIKRKDLKGPQIDEAFVFTTDKNVIDSFPNRNYTVKKYNSLRHGINVHTWGLDYSDPEIEARILSNNVLNNIELAAGVSYNYDRQLFRPFARLQIAKWYPELSLQGSYLQRSAVIDNERREWAEVDLHGGIGVNLDLSTRSYRRAISPHLGLNFTDFNGDIAGDLWSSSIQILFLQQQIKAQKNIFTHSGQYLALQYRKSLDDLVASQVQVRSALAIRGLGINHNLILKGDFKLDGENDDYQFSTGLNHRGFGVIPSEKVFRASADYHFPLLYPDWGFAGLVYFYRLRSNLFYEHSAITNGMMDERYQSIGAELIFEVNLVNAVESTVGIRYSYPLNDSFKPSFEIFLPVYRF